MLKTREANKSDCKDIFNWRNDEITIQMSNSATKISWKNHCEWFRQSQNNPNRLLVICEDKDANEKIGIVRFDVKNERALISINLSPNMRGKQKAKACLEAAISFFRMVYSEVQFIDAEVKSINIPSQKSFLGAGFSFVREIDDVFLYETIL